MKPYGKELIIDLHNCDPDTFTRKSIRSYLKGLCEVIDMKRCKLHFWDDVGVPKRYKQVEAHTKGTSAVQFILTSNITLHALDELKAVYINIFSCKDFNIYKAAEFSYKWFDGDMVNDLEATDRL